MDYCKYPKTYYLPWSKLEIYGNDRVLENDENFKNRPILVSEKRDGENTSLYSDGFVHARSIDSDNHPSRTWIKNFGLNAIINVH